MTTNQTPPSSSLVLYATEDGRMRVQCRFEEATIWLTQAQMADPTIRKFRIVRTEGRREVGREIEHYSLPLILAVGYRVRSPRGTQFRQWATARLEEFLVKGFVLDDERLKNPPGPGVPDHFDEAADQLAPYFRIYLNTGSSGIRVKQRRTSINTPSPLTKR
ncbi:MAG: RhuM family protein [Planctomycetaceae bacterium]|nr:RhuM family protein [Planctomycetaceae bacterium]